MTQDELAEKTGYKSRSSINKIEKGGNDLSQSKIVLFAKILQTTNRITSQMIEKHRKITSNSNQMLIKVVTLTLMMQFLLHSL